jgi:DNA-binding protein WhiA
MELMLNKVERDLRNRVNRQVNCETGNLSKTVEAAARQIEAIQRLEAAGKLQELPEALRQTAMLRLQNPELSLSELIPLHTPTLSRPGLSGRIRKLMKLAEELPL